MLVKWKTLKNTPLDARAINKELDGEFFDPDKDIMEYVNMGFIRQINEDIEVYANIIELNEHGE